MAIQLVGIRTTASSVAGATSLTVSMPDGTGGDFDAFASGDFAVLVAEVTSATAAAWSAPGWDFQAGDAGAAAQIAVLTKRLNSGDTSVTVSPGLASGQVSGLSAVVRVYRGVDPGTPLDVAAVADGSSSATASVAAASLTVATAGAVVLAAYGQTTPGGTSYTNWVAPAGMGNPGITCSTAAAVNNAALATWDMTVAAAGATGTLTATSPQSRAWVYATLALTPAPPATPAAFPDVPLDIGVEIKLPGDGWTDITPYVYERDPITIVRGQSADASSADPSTLALTVNNRDARFSPRSPAGAYYGLIGRNTPIRVSVDRPGTPDTVLDCTGSGDGVTATDSATLDITGDIDVRVDVAPRLGIWASRTCLLSKYTTVDDQRSWLIWQQTADGAIGFSWSQDGTGAETAQVLATDTIDVTAERLALRATLHVSTATVTFYTAPTIAGPWTQLGAPVVLNATTAIFASTTPVAIGHAGTDLDDFNGFVYAAQVLNGINGTAVIDVDFTAADEGATSITDDAGAAWTIHPGSAVIAPDGLRFCGEVSEWPVRWDSTGTDVYATVTAAGILRRLQQGSVPVQSTMTRTQSIKPTMRAYWPCEEGPDATQISSGLGGPPMNFGGTVLPSFGNYSGFHCSNPIPTMNDAEWIGNVPPYSDTGEIQVRFLLNVPSDTDAAATESILAVSTSGTAALWHLSYQGANALQLQAFDDSGTSIWSSGPVSFPINGADSRVSILLTQSGSSVIATIATYAIFAGGGFFHTETVPSTNIGRATGVIVNNGGGITDFAVGQITVEDKVVSIFDDIDQVNAYIGETAGRRFLRLAGENGVYARCYGSPDDTPRMGPQDPDTLINLLNGCVSTDDGQMFEPRDIVGVAMRTRASMQNQAAAVTLDYRTDLAGDIEPTDDDRYTVNDVTVTRTGGSSTQVEDTTGPLNVSDPPDGAGRYTSEIDLSLYRDLDTIDQAWWHLHRGTVDEPRYPTLTVDMSRRDITGDATVQAQLVAADIGDRLTVTNPPAWLPPGIDQVLVGVTETLSSFTRTHAYALAPYSPYVVAAYGADRYDTAGSELATGVTSTATTLTVRTDAGPVWTTAAADLPFDIVVGGERMTVTAITGTSSPQTFTVTRSVNAITKAHTAGADVRLYQPAIRAL